jgi:hypothetical protein
MSIAIGTTTPIAAPEEAREASKGETTMSKARERSRARRSAEAEYRLIAILTFPFFLLIAAASFLVPRALRARLPGLDVDGSLFARTRALAGASIPFAFMG